VFVAHPDALAGFAIGTLVIELGAPLALVGRRVARVWAAAAWSFHVGVVLTMNVWFPYPLLGLAFLPVLDGERIVLGLQSRWRSRRGARGALRNAPRPEAVSSGTK
jgi:hypothetical protein